MLPQNGRNAFIKSYFLLSFTDLSNEDNSQNFNLVHTYIVEMERLKVINIIFST